MSTRCKWCQRDMPPQAQRGRPREFCGATCRKAHQRAVDRILAEHEVDTLIERVWGVLNEWYSPDLDLTAMTHSLMRIRLDELAAHPLIVGSQSARLKFTAEPIVDPGPSSLNGISPAPPSAPAVQGRGYINKR